MADYTYTNSARSSSCQQFHPEGHQAQNAKSGRVLLKLCHCHFINLQLFTSNRAPRTRVQ